MRKQQSELLKEDFIHLFSILKQFHGTVYVSSPTPTFGRMGHFSRLLSINTWLSSACVTHGVQFIDNFNLFWQCSHLFGADGVHLNKAGAQVLSANLAYSFAHPHAPVFTTNCMASTCPLRHHNVPISQPSAAWS